MIYDLIIIGTGPIALGCITSIPDNLKVAVITHKNDNGYKFDSFGDKTYSERYGGGLDSWHSVLSSKLFLEYFPDKLNFYKSFFNFFYPQKNVDNKNFRPEKIFVPKKRISTTTLDKLVSQKRNIELIFDEILIIDESRNIILKSKEKKYLTKKVILAAGAIGTGKILNKSYLANLNGYIGNHINAYGAFNIPVDKDFIQPKYSKHGHFKNIELGSIKNHDYMSYLRPSLFDFKDPSQLGKFKTIYTRTKKEIYSTIIKSLSPGLLIEAFYNRYGLWFFANKANSYVQIEVSDVYQLDENFNVMVDKSKLNFFINEITKNSKFKDFSLDTLVSGVHFYSTVEKNNNIGNCCYDSDWDNRILVADSANIAKIGGAHHTFSTMAMASLAVHEIYKS